MRELPALKDGASRSCRHEPRKVKHIATGSSPRFSRTSRCAWISPSKPSSGGWRLEKTLVIPGSRGKGGMIVSPIRSLGSNTARTFSTSRLEERGDEVFRAPW